MFHLAVRVSRLAWFVFLASVVVVLPSLVGAFPTMESSSFSARTLNDALSTTERFPIASSEAAKGYFYQPSAEDNFFRSFRQNTPVRFQYFLRDSGLLRLLADTLTWTTVAPAIVRKHPATVGKFLQLSGCPPAIVQAVNRVYKVPRNEKQHQYRVEFQNLQYGSHARQSVHLMQPYKCSKSRSDNPQSPCQNLVLFVHGGAWGSGTPEMYRLVATPFLEQDISVAVAGYRTYPDGTVQDQIDDLVTVLQKLQDEGVVDSATTKITLMGHSSGAHLCALALLCHPNLRASVDCFVGLAGVYDIPSHYQYERLRGVERLSPMAVVCGATATKSSKLTTPSPVVLHKWKRSSPTRMVNTVVPSLDDDSFPPALILHGAQDTTVPVESPLRFAESLQGALVSNNDMVDLVILPEVGHVDFITDLMFDGPSKNLVLDWMKSKGSIR